MMLLNKSSAQLDLMTSYRFRLFPNISVKNLAVLFDPMLSFDQHVESINRTALFHLRNCTETVTVIKGFTNTTNLT